MSGLCRLWEGYYIWIYIIQETDNILCHLGTVFVAQGLDTVLSSGDTIQFSVRT